MPIKHLREVYANEMRVERIVEFLMGHSLFPKSYYYFLTTLEKHLKAVHQEGQSNKAAKLVKKLKMNLSYLEWDKYLLVRRNTR